MKLKLFDVSAVLDKVEFAASGQINIRLHIMATDEEEAESKFLDSKEVTYLFFIGYKILPDNKITINKPTQVGSSIDEGK